MKWPLLSRKDLMEALMEWPQHEEFTEPEPRRRGKALPRSPRFGLTASERAMTKMALASVERLLAERQEQRQFHGLGSAESVRKIHAEPVPGLQDESREGSGYLALARASVEGPGIGERCE